MEELESKGLSKSFKLVSKISTSGVTIFIYMVL